MLGVTNASAAAADDPYGQEGEVMADAGAAQESAHSSDSNTENSEDEWNLEHEVKRDLDSQRSRGLPAGYGLALTWKNLSVRGTGGKENIQYKLDLGTFLFPWTNLVAHYRINKLSKQLIAKEPPAVKQMHWSPGDKRPKRGQPGLRRGQRYLIHDFTGCLKPGEMMLVVGRPGSGCSTFLKSLAGLTKAYAGVDGDIYYGAERYDSKTFRPYRSDIAYNDEDDLHDPNLLVGRTMDFALRMETPSERARPLRDEKPMKGHAWRLMRQTNILRALGIEHTLGTKVGNQYVRGVSGGERKRVSLAEMMTTNAKIMFWDNATRGLDASSALAFNKVLRLLSDTTNRINVTTLYQAGNGIYDLFDKVTIIAEGQIIYYGPREKARPYFEAMGFEHMEGANTADYLTAVTALNERTVKPEFQGRVPNTAAEFAQKYLKSDIYRDMCEEVEETLNDKEARQEETDKAKEVLAAEKSTMAVKLHPERASVFTQIWALTIKEAQARWGDKPVLIARQGTTFVMSFIAGSVFYQLPKTTAGLYLRGGAIFILVFYPSILAFSDVQAAFVGRMVLAKHKSYDMYFGACIILAMTIVDIPLVFFQMVIWTIVFYFLAGLQYNARKYFIALLFCFVVTCANTALFRTIGFVFKNYNDASKVAGTIFTIFVLYSGFIIYQPSMKPWFGWTRWLNPAFYGVEAVCAEEFTGISFRCVAPDLAPIGPQYVGQPQGCAVTGSVVGSTIVPGSRYLHMALEFSTTHVWRNLGIIFGIWINSAFLGMIFLQRMPAAGSTQQVTLFKRGGGTQYLQQQIEKTEDPRDEEHGGVTQQSIQTPAGPSPTGQTPPGQSFTGPVCGPQLGEPLHRWGTTTSEVSPRQWPPLQRIHSTCSQHGEDCEEYRNRLQRQTSRLSERSPRAVKAPLVAVSESEESSPGSTLHGGELALSEKAPRPSGEEGVLSEKAARLGGPGSPGGSVTGQREIKGTTFTWKDLDYTVKEGGKDKPLLRKVSGYCKAGTITALMGSSGAGKTTLMDVLAARKDTGVITGEVRLNGKKLPVSFQRTTGYCEQVDVHMPQATVREALEFSALLRQPRHLSDKEKLNYVDEIIDLLELGDIEDAIIGTPGEGLGVEQRKRVTIGVELVSKPTLLFLDEPTSGLDGQSSYMIVGFLQKLAAAGQSILCTIHQPSAALFAGFDMLLLLKAGGRTVYMGPVEDVPNYFIDKGVNWPKGVNPAEFMIDIVSGELSRERDWSEVWNDSQERQNMLTELETLKRDSATPDAVEGNEEAEEAEESAEDTNEFAAPITKQMWLVYVRANVQLWRDVTYVSNKLLLHILTALILGFSFFKIGNSLGDLKNRVYVLFQFAFVAPAVIVQTQPKFIANRDIFEAREKKAKFYCWQVFCFGEIAAEFPYLLICAFLFWCCWYPTAGLDLNGNVAGPVFLQMCFYEFLYTGMGQFIAAYAPNPIFAALVIPLIIIILALFCGIIVPYMALNVFWRYWMYWLDPFTYLMQGLITFPIWGVRVVCEQDEYGYLNPPAGMTCGEYFAPYINSGAPGYLANPNDTEMCAYCAYKKGSEYLHTLNINTRARGWGGIFLTLLFAISSYTLVFVLLKLRSKASKTAS